MRAPESPAPSRALAPGAPGVIAAGALCIAAATLVGGLIAGVQPASGRVALSASSSAPEARMR